MAYLHRLWAALGSLGSPQQQRLAALSNLLDFPSQAHLCLCQTTQRAAQLLLQDLCIAFVNLLHTSTALMILRNTFSLEPQAEMLSGIPNERAWAKVIATLVVHCSFDQGASGVQGETATKPTSSSMVLCRTLTPLCMACSASSPSRSCPKYLHSSQVFLQGFGRAQRCTSSCNTAASLIAKLTAR